MRFPCAVVDDSFFISPVIICNLCNKKNKLKEIMKAELKIEEEPLFFIISLFGDAKLILITVNELNRVWENYVKSKPFSDNRTP